MQKLTITEAKSFRPPFSKGGAVKGPRPLSPTAVGETPPPGVSFLQSFFLCAFSAKEKSVEELPAYYPCRPANAGNAARGVRRSAERPNPRGRHSLSATAERGGTRKFLLLSSEKRTKYQEVSPGEVDRKVVYERRAQAFARVTDSPPPRALKKARAGAA